MFTSPRLDDFLLLHSSAQMNRVEIVIEILPSASCDDSICPSDAPSVSSQIFATDALDDFSSSQPSRLHAGKAQQSSIFAPEDEAVKFRTGPQAHVSSVFSQDMLTKAQVIRISAGGSAHAGHLSSDLVPTEETRHIRPYAGQTLHSSVFSGQDIPNKAQGIRISSGGSAHAGHLSSDLVPT